MDLTSESYEHIDTDINDENDAEDSTWKSAFVKEGLFAKLRPLNRNAREAFHKLATSEDISEHHRQFILVEPDIEKTPFRTGCFILSLGMLPEFPPLGWRIGSGRKKQPNLGVDLLIYEGTEVASLHARLSWVKDGGGFFIIADNLRGGTVLLNGEAFSNERRLIPFANMIGIGECYFRLEFPTRLPEEEEQFRVELSAFYSKVHQDAAPLILPTPSDNEERVGDWMVRNAIAMGGSGRVSIVTHARTGKSAAMKELWRTPRNSGAIDREVSIARALKNIKHVRRATLVTYVCTLLII